MTSVILAILAQCNLQGLSHRQVSDLGMCFLSSYILGRVTITASAYLVDCQNRANSQFNGQAVIMATTHHSYWTYVNRITNSVCIPHCFKPTPADNIMLTTRNNGILFQSPPYLRRT